MPPNFIKKYFRKSDKFTIESAVDVDDIMNFLLNLNCPQIEAIIKQLDAECQDWGVTLSLAEHFLSVVVKGQDFLNDDEDNLKKIKTLAAKLK